MNRHIIAHRGLSAIAPENTLAALKLCRDYGVSWFETDVDIIADGTPVVIHDSQLDRTTNSSGSIYELSKKDLADIDAGSWFSPAYAGERIPTLAQVIELMNTHKLNANIEIKSNEQGAEKTYQLIDAVIAQLDKLNPERQVLVSSFNHLLLAEFKRRAPQYQLAALMSQACLRPDWLSVLELIGAAAINVEDGALTAERIKLANRAGYPVNAWTVNSRQRAQQLLDWGVNSVISDHAHQFIDLEQH
ncbi:MAG: glycerophosphoryl diester phosphodiesterase [Rothia sp. (in: high G+C Gram-positive bacteria)]|nr:glycerophosphoryl diester phosphodiesterase [Rothia sp. (in: high G+C Gram-positive bacteria)]